MPSSAHARRDSPTLARIPLWFVEVRLRVVNPTVPYIRDLLQIAVWSTTVAVVQMLPAHMIVQRMQSNALAILALPIPVLRRRSSVQVRRIVTDAETPSIIHGRHCLLSFSDGCLVKNGGCDANAVCSHDSKTYAIRCNCRTGFINVGCICNPVCAGTAMTETIKSICSLFLLLLLTDECDVNNGDCGLNAACTHDAKTNAVQCVCQTGYTNIGTRLDVICAGTNHLILPTHPSFSFLFYRQLSSEQRRL